MNHQSYKDAYKNKCTHAVEFIGALLRSYKDDYIDRKAIEVIINETLREKPDGDFGLPFVDPDDPEGGWHE